MTCVLEMCFTLTTALQGTIAEFGGTLLVSAVAFVCPPVALAAGAAALAGTGSTIAAA